MSSGCRWSVGWIVMGLVGGGGVALAQGPSFRGLGFVPGSAPSSAAMAVSSDGAFIAGWCDLDAVRWAGMNPQSLGRLPAPFDGLAVAYGVSGDGGTVVGFSKGVTPTSPLWAFVWSADRGMMPIGPQPAPDSIYGSYATGISADGRVVVGASDDGTGYPRAFALGPVREWTALTDNPSTASAVSADGSVVVGVVNINDVDQAFSWSETTGMILLGDLPGGDPGSVAYAVNADGTIVVGGSPSASSNPSYDYEAFRWTAGNADMIPLGDLPGGDYSSEARAVSADGSVIVGLSSVDPSPRTAAFIWDAVHGMRDLRTVLVTDYALDLTGWDLSTAQAISADGRTIVGRGINPAGQFEGWIAHLEPRCRADWNNDGVVDSTDFVAFVNSFLCTGSACPSADFNSDGVVNSADFFDYVVAFFGVCN